jgi:hypothetical protein
LAFWTIFYDTYRHAWRRRVPFALAGLLLLGLLVMPRLLSGDGSPEGELRLFLLYAGHCALFALSLLGIGYAIWSEAQERRLGVDQIIATRPVGLTTLLSARILAILSLLLLLAIVDLGLLVTVAWKGVHGRYEETLSGPELKDRLLKVHQFKNLYYLGEKGELRELGKKTKKKVKLSPGIFHIWDLPLKHDKEAIQVSGQFLSVDSDLDVHLDLRVQNSDRALWRDTVSIRTGQPFRFSLPPALQDHRELKLMVRQINSSKEPVIYTSLHPFQIQEPGGRLGANIFRALTKLSLLWFYLITLAYVLARLLPPQSSLLPMGLVSIIGMYRSSIQNVLFPVSKVPEEFRAAQGLGDILYLILWKPLLFLVPDFQSLNPIPALARGERILFDQLSSQLVPIICVIILGVLTARYFLPQRERLPQR